MRRREFIISSLSIGFAGCGGKIEAPTAAREEAGTATETTTAERAADTPPSGVRAGYTTYGGHING